MGGATAPGARGRSRRSRGCFTGDDPPKEGGAVPKIMVRAEQDDRHRVVSLDERDHAILLSLLEHKVLTTHQTKNLFFRSFRRCQHRMKELRDLGFIASFTPGRGFGEGRPSACFILTRLGLSEIAEAKGVRTSDLSWIPNHGYRT